MTNPGAEKGSAELPESGTNTEPRTAKKCLKREGNCDGIKSDECCYSSEVCAGVKTLTRIIVSPEGQSVEDLNAYQNLLREAPFVEICWDVQDDWRVKCISPNITSVLGYAPEEFVSGAVKFRDIIHPEDRDRALQKTERGHENLADTHVQTYRLLRKDGSVIFVSDRSLNKYDEYGRVKYHFGYIHDISELKDTEMKKEEALERVRKMMLFDKETGVPNRDKFLEDTETIKDGRLFIVRLNRFSTFNSMFGYEKGNLVITETLNKIRAVGQRFEGFVGIYRLSGVEFGLLIRKNYESKTEDVSRALTEALSVALFFDGFDHPMSMDYGIGITDKSDNLLHSGMIAVVKAKELKTNVQYSDELEDELREYHSKNAFWVNEISSAITHGMVVPVFQGIRNNKTGAIEKYESLVRIRDGEKLISPGTFMDVAKASGQDASITVAMLSRVLTRIKETGCDHSVNMSMNDLVQPGIVDFIKYSAHEYEVHPSKLLIEILEEVPNMNAMAMENVRKFKEEGFKLAIDDFGTGYSNLLRLLEINPEYLKIDGQIVRGCSKSEKQLSVLKMIVGFAQSNGIKTVAEFVDNQEDQNVVESLGIDYTQGYLFSVPSE